MVDAEDGFGNAVNVRRTVQEMEAAGVAAIEIEDNVVPKRFNVQHPGLVSKEEQVGKLQAAVAARTDPSTVIVARTSALAECPLEEALDRVRAYATTGAEALMLATVPRGRADIAAVHSATSLPLCVLNLLRRRGTCSLPGRQRGPHSDAGEPDLRYSGQGYL